MSDHVSAADAELVRLMTQAADSVLADDNAYDVANRTRAEMVHGPVLTEAMHGGAAYVLWAKISDLVDAPGGPFSDEACASAAKAVASDWLGVDPDSPDSIASYF